MAIDRRSSDLVFCRSHLAIRSWLVDFALAAAADVARGAIGSFPLAAIGGKKHLFGDEAGSRLCWNVRGRWELSLFGLREKM